MHEGTDAPRGGDVQSPGNPAPLDPLRVQSRADEAQPPRHPNRTIGAERLAFVPTKAGWIYPVSKMVTEAVDARLRAMGWTS